MISLKRVDYSKDIYNMNKCSKSILYRRELIINKKINKFIKLLSSNYIDTPENYKKMFNKKSELRELVLLQTMYSYKMNDKRYKVYEKQLEQFKVIYMYWKGLTRNTFLTYVMGVPQFLVNIFYGGI